MLRSCFFRAISIRVLLGTVGSWRHSSRISLGSLLKISGWFVRETIQKNRGDIKKKLHLPHADAQHLDEIRFSSQNLQNAVLDQGLHPLARGIFPDGGHRF